MRTYCNLQCVVLVVVYSGVYMLHGPLWKVFAMGVSSVAPPFFHALQTLIISNVYGHYNGRFGQKIGPSLTSSHTV